MTRSLRLLTFMVVAAAAALPAGAALARPTRVALCRIAGDTSGLDQAVAGALEEGELEVVAGKQVARAMDRLGLASPLGDRELTKLADELEVDAVVKGAFDRRGHRLRFTIFAGGKQGKPFSMLVGNAGSDKFRQLVRSTVEGKLAQAVTKRRSHESDEVADDEPPARHKAKHADKTAEAAADDEPPAKHKARPADKTEAAADDEPPAKHKARPADKAEAAADDEPPAKHKARPADKAEAAADDEPPAKHKARPADKAEAAAAAAEPAARPAAKGDDAPAPAGPRVATRDDDAPAASVHARVELDRAGPGPARTANLAALRVDLGGSMAGRSLKFDTRSFNGAPRPYSNKPVPGVRVAGEIYPGALIAPDRWFAGFGVAADYDRTMALTLRASNETTVPLAITDQHYEFGARYRLAFGHSATSPTLTAGVGYAARRFAVNRSGLQSTSSIDLPDVDYRMFDPGLAFRMPLGGHVAVTVAGEALLVTAIGAMQHADQYGATHVLGGSASAGVEVLVNQRLLIRLAAEATQLSLSFVGHGMLVNSRDGDPSTVDVRGATDRYYGGVATAVVTY